MKKVAFIAKGVYSRGDGKVLMDELATENIYDVNPQSIHGCKAG